MKVLYLYLFAVVWSSVFSNVGYSQSRVRYISVYQGVHIFKADPWDKKNIRSSESFSFDDKAAISETIKTHFLSMFMGVKAEVVTNNERFSFLSGLQYTQMTGVIARKGFLFSDPPYFFYRYRESGTTTEYAKIREIRQNTNCLTVPLEVRFFFFRPRKFGVYVMGASQVNFKQSVKNEIVFDNDSMKMYTNAVTSTLEEPGDVNAFFYIGMGMRFGSRRASFGLETAAPSFYTGGKTVGIVKPSAGIGLQWYLSIRLGSIQYE
jgi:hypothetical protein